MSNPAASVVRVWPQTSPSQRADPQTEGIDWIRSLRSSGAEREQAAARLHARLVHAARFELLRRGAAWNGGGETVDDLAVQSADTALAAIMGKLDEYRFESRFTTWAYKFVVLEAALLVRRRAWQDREMLIDPEAWGRLSPVTSELSDEVEVRERLRRAIDAIQSELSPHQREVLTALVLGDVPIDVLADRLNTTRGALYKTLHDARRKLRRVVALERDA